ncbi:MAG: hypothetical protein ABI876_09240 [Bacteroidota bacterium]
MALIGIAPIGCTRDSESSRVATNGSTKKVKADTAIIAVSKNVMRATDIFNSFELFPTTGFDTNNIQGIKRNSRTPFMLRTDSNYSLYRAFVTSSGFASFRNRVMNDSVMLNDRYSSSMMLIILGSMSGNYGPLAAVVFYNDDGGVAYLTTLDSMRAIMKPVPQLVSHLCKSVLLLRPGSVEEVSSEGGHFALVSISSNGDHFNMIAGQEVIMTNYSGYEDPDFADFKSHIPPSTFRQRLYVDSLIQFISGMGSKQWK